MGTIFAVQHNQAETLTPQQLDKLTVSFLVL